MKIKTLLCFLLSMSFICSYHLKAQWTTTPDSTLQISPWGVNVDACTDSNGGCYVAFTNFSYVKTRYYIQKVNKFGYNEWASPVMIGDTANLCVRARLTPVNNFNGVIAAYYARSVKETIQAKIIYTGKLFLQKIDSTGKLLWGTNGVRASVDTFDQDGFGYPTVISDDSGGVFVMWKDERNEGTDINGSLNVQRISSDGKRLWGEYGLQIIDTVGSSEFVMTKTNNGIFVLFFARNTSNNLTKLDYNGNILWNKVLSNDYSKYFSKMEADELNNIFLGGTKSIDQNFMLLSYLVKKLNSNGENVWNEDVIIVDSLPNESSFYDLKKINSDNTRLLATWKPKTERSRIQFLDSEGIKLLSDSQTTVSSNYSSNAIHYTGESDSASVIAILSDNRTGEQLYYGQKILLNGEKQWNENDVLLTTYKADNNQIVLRKVITDSQGGIIAIGSIEPHWGIYGIQVNKNGILGSVITRVNDSKNFAPQHFELFQNYPNPFNPSTEIKYQISEVSRIILKVYDMLGREIVTLVNENKQPGYYAVRWNATGITSGVYFYRLEAQKQVETKRMILIK